MKELTRLYAVLLFPPEKGTEEETVNVVPQSWVKKDGKICLWPKIKNPNKLIEECTSPVDVACEWQEFEYKAKCKDNIEGYSKAKIVEKNVLDEKENNLSELSDVPKKRPRIRKNPFSPTSYSSLNSCVSEEINDADVESEDISSPIRRRCFRISPLPDDDSADESNRSPKFPTPPTKAKSHFNTPRSLFDGESSANNTKPPSTIRLVKTSKSHQNIPKEPLAQVSSNSDHNKSRQSHIPSTSGPSASLDFHNLFMPTSKSLTTFHTQWQKMSAEQKEIYQAETLFVMRRTLPLIVSKLDPGTPATSAAIDGIRTHPNLTCFPINDEDNLNSAKKLLKMKGWKQKLTTLLLSKKCKDLRETARAMCSFLFTDQFGSGYSMVGQKKKKSFIQLPIVTLLKKTISAAFNTESRVSITDEEINEAVEAWLKYCKNRLEPKSKPGKKMKQAAELPPSDEEED